MVSDLADALEPPNEKAWASTWIAGLANPAQVAKDVSPLNFIRASVPAVISIHGDADPEVPYSQSVRLHEALKRVGVSEELITIRGGVMVGLVEWRRSEHSPLSELFLPERASVRFQRRIDRRHKGGCLTRFAADGGRRDNERPRLNPGRSGAMR